MRCKNFLKVYKNTVKNMFRKNNDTINCDDNDDAICSLVLGPLVLLGSPWNEISLEVLDLSICIATRSFYLG